MDEIREFFEGIGFRVNSVNREGNYNIYCPLHNEQEASLFIKPKTDEYKCFGACGSRGKGVVNFLRKVDREKAKEWEYRYMALMPAIWTTSYYAEDEKTPTKPLIDIDSLSLAKSELSYFEERRITQDTINMFGIKYHKAFDSLVVPVFDLYGNYIFYIQRKLSSKPKYQNSADSESSNHLFALNRIKLPLLDDRIVVVEGITDAIRAHQEGITNCVATMGGELTEKQARLIGRYTRTVVLYADKDLQGIRITERNTTICQRYGYTILYSRAPGGAKDLAAATNPSQLDAAQYFLLKYRKIPFKTFILD